MPNQSIRLAAGIPMPAHSTDDKTALIHAVRTGFDTLFTWRYDQGERMPLDALYKKAKLAQWDADLDIDWTVGGQIDRARDPSDALNALSLSNEGVFARLNAKERADF